MTPAPFLPTMLAATDAAFANEVVGSRRRMAFALGGTECQVRFLPLGRPAAGPCFRLSDGARHAWLRLADWDALPPIAALCGGAFAALPDELQPVVVETALAPLLDALGNATGSAWRIDGAAGWPAEREHEIAFELRDPQGTSRVGTLALSAAAAADFPKLVRQAPPLPWRSLDAVPLPVRLLLGETRVPRADLAGLRPNDVLIVERWYFPAEGDAAPAQVVAGIGGVLAFEARIATGQATLGPAVAPPSEAAEPLVRFEIAGSPLALGAARALKPGATIPFDAEAGVALTLSDRPIAAGALVRCGERFGVRLR